MLQVSALKILRWVRLMYIVYKRKNLPISRYLRCFLSYNSHVTLLKRLRSLDMRSFSSCGSFGFLTWSINHLLTKNHIGNERKSIVVNWIQFQGNRKRGRFGRKTWPSAVSCKWGRRRCKELGLARLCYQTDRWFGIWVKGTSRQSARRFPFRWSWTVYISCFYFGVRIDFVMLTSQ